MSFFRDLSLSAVVTGFVVVLVGFTSTGALVFQAALSLGATQAQVNSWMWALGLGMGLASIIPSLIYKKPVVAAWSTPGAALIATSARGGRRIRAVRGAYHRRGRVEIVRTHDESHSGCHRIGDARGRVAAVRA